MPARRKSSTQREGVFNGRGPAPLPTTPRQSRPPQDSPDHPKTVPTTPRQSRPPQDSPDHPKTVPTTPDSRPPQTSRPPRACPPPDQPALPQLKDPRTVGAARGSGRRGSYFLPAEYEAGRLSRLPTLLWAGRGGSWVELRPGSGCVPGDGRRARRRPDGACAVHARGSCALCAPRAPAACGRCCRDARICATAPGSWRCSSSS